MIDCPIAGCEHRCRDDRARFVHVMHYHSKLAVLNALVGLSPDQCRVCGMSLHILTAEDDNAHFQCHRKNELVGALLAICEEKEASVVT
jgi:hypothetical protein